MKRRSVLAAGVLAASTLLAACGGGGGGAAQDLSVTAVQGFKYDPNTWTMKSGQAYKVTLHNNDPTQAHTWVVPELGSTWKLRAEAGKTVSKTLTPNKTGTFQVECDEPGHKDAGMTGTLTVS